VEGCRRINANEVFFDCIFSPDGNSMDRLLSLMRQVRAFV
jgi:hypothetical protein